MAKPTSTPTRHFQIFVANKSAYSNRPLGLPCATLGWPLRGPWVAQGWPKPNPSRQRVATDARPKYTNTKYQLPVLLASSQQLGASRFSFQRPFNTPLFRSGANLQLYHLFAFLSTKKGPFLAKKVCRRSEKLSAHGVEQAFRLAVRSKEKNRSSRRMPARSGASLAERERMRPHSRRIYTFSFFFNSGSQPSAKSSQVGFMLTIS